MGGGGPVRPGNGGDLAGGLWTRGAGHHFDLVVDGVGWSGVGVCLCQPCIGRAWPAGGEFGALPAIDGVGDGGIVFIGRPSQCAHESFGGDGSVAGTGGLVDHCPGAAGRAGACAQDGGSLAGGPFVVFGGLLWTVEPGDGVGVAGWGAGARSAQ